MKATSKTIINKGILGGLRGVKRKSIIGICNPLLDITIQAKNKEFLNQYQIKAGNAILAEQQIHKKLLEEAWKDPLKQLVPGGSGLNTIRAAHYMMKARVKDECKYFGAIADDEQGNELERILREEGVQSLMHKDKSGVQKTGVCAAVVYEKERSLIADLGAALKFPLEHLDAHQNQIQEAKIIYGTSFFLSTNKEALFQLAEQSLKNKQCFGLNLSAKFLIDQYKDDIEKLIPYCDFIFGNEDEISHFVYATTKKSSAQSVSQSQSDIEGQSSEFSMKEVEEEAFFEMCKSIQNKYTMLKPIRNIIVTRGALPTIVSMGNQDYFSFPVNKLMQEQIVDTNGAGDSFVGGFLSQIAIDDLIEEELASSSNSKQNERNSAIKRALIAGNTCSSLVLQQTGCNFPKHISPPDPFQFLSQ